ncbi:LOW QUALITY PROTEIN: hypothetical protein CFOL_v3_36387, partial [Cephalotus follicularis]
YTQDDSQNSQNDFQEINELISPTYSEMKPLSQLMTIIIDEIFEINKNLIRKDFLQEKYLRKRHKFFQKYSEDEQNNIRTAWYEYMIKIKAHIMFFDYLPIYKNQQENKKYFTEEKIQKIFMNQKTTTTWLTSDNKIIEAIHPPSEKIQINVQNNQIQSAPFKLQNETSITTQETNKIIEQNNYTNRHIQTLGSQLSRIENIIQDKIQHSREETKNQDQKIKPLFTPYKIPSSQIKQLTLNEINERLRQIVPDNLQIEERGKFTQATYQSGTIYEWNIDGMNEYHIINKLQEMTMVNNAHKIRNNSDKDVANILIDGFTGQIKGWWDNVLTTQQQNEILESIQVNELKEPILDANNETIEDVVSTLIYNIANYFVGDPTYLKDRTADQLSNLRCRKLQDLPTLFAEKIKNKYREKHKGVVPYEKLTYGDIVSTITKTGLEICYDIKMSKQIKRDSKTYKKELGDFCTQFGYETFKPPPSKNLQKPKIDRKNYYKKQFEKPEYYRKPNKRKTHFKTNKYQKSNNDFPKTNSTICYNCGKTSHIAKYCYIRKQIKKLDLTEDHRNQI